jgi:hypothetical protein
MNVYNGIATESLEQKTEPSRHIPPRQASAMLRPASLKSKCVIKYKKLRSFERRQRRKMGQTARGHETGGANYARTGPGHVPSRQTAINPVAE